MKFSTREDIEATQQEVFEAVSNFQGFERMIMRRGAEVVRLDTQVDKSVGMCWDVSFKFRGRERNARATLMQYNPPEGFLITSESGGIDAEIEVKVLQLSPKRTRMMVSMDMKPKSLSARLLIQSLKLAKGSLNSKFKTRVADFAQSIEAKGKAAA